VAARGAQAVRGGLITPIGPTTDPKAIAHKIGGLNGQNRIVSLAFDR